jgi:hypothetical protein
MRPRPRCSLTTGRAPTGDPPHGPTGRGVSEAVETVLHADLLMRQLDRIANKLGKPL